MAPVRVFHVITRMIIGGAQENTLLTLEGLRRRPDRWDAVLVTGPQAGPEGSLLDRARAGGVPVVIVPTLVRDPAPVRDLRALAFLIELFRRERPDIVHTHSAKAGILGRAAARRAGVAAVVHTVHGPTFHPHQPRLVRAFYQAMERRAGGWTDAFVAVGGAMRRHALDAGLTTPERIRVIPSGIETERFLSPNPPGAEVRRRLDIPAGAPVIAVVARLAPLKGHDAVFAAFAELRRDRPDLRLLLVGDGLLRAALEETASRGGFRDAVTFAGLVSPEAVPSHLAAADVVVHASVREGLPRVLPQALLAGRPVVAVDCDGASDVVRPGETGWLVPPGDPGALAGAVRDALDRPDEARRRAEAGRAACREVFDVRRMVEALERLYDELLPGTGDP